MKIILSRKGFDASAGKVPSPIFPSGTLCSLPIPEHDHRPEERPSRRYQEIMIGDQPLGTIVNDLTQGTTTPNHLAHFDPDLNITSISSRPANWKPVFGQAGAAEKHLQNQGVKAGDVFVFYGWFKQVELCAGTYRYVVGAPDLHVIFGWLQIERRIPVDKPSEIPLWASNHPHYCRTKYGSLDSLYISTDRLELPNVVIDKSGAGVFRMFDPALCLTAPRQSRSIWSLPCWFYPHGKKSVLSYHRNLSRWQLEQDCVLLSSVGRGQEFVLDCEDYPESVEWLARLLSLV
jgi:Nucleotide modification associated domain 3